MDSKKYLLAQNIAFLLSLPSESNLAKLLKFCLVTSITDRTSDENALEIATALMKEPEDLPYWLQKVMAIDNRYTPEEWKAIGDMNIRNTKEFVEKLWQELDELNL